MTKGNAKECSNCIKLHLHHSIISQDLKELNWNSITSILAKSTLKEVFRIPMQLPAQKLLEGLPWWSSGYESAL